MLASRAMVQIALAIEGDCCGPMSIGTVGVILAIRDRLGMSLAEAQACVDRCVFDGERITLAASTREAADALLASFARLPAAPRIHATVLDGSLRET